MRVVPEGCARRGIAFLAANCSFSHTNLAAWYLRANVSDLGWDWQTVELTITEDIAPSLARLAELKPRVLAATLYLFNRNCVLSIVRRHKAMFPDCTVVVGGPELLGDNRAFLEAERSVDAAIRGEGETAFRELLNLIDAPGSRRGIRGFCGFAGRRYFDNGRAREIECLDDIPSPFTADSSPFTDGSFAFSRSKPFVQIEASRGCANRCSFCVSGSSGRVRCFSLPRVRSDLEAIREAGVRSVRFVDRTFNDNGRRCGGLLRMFREDFPGMDFHLEIDPARMTAPLFNELAASAQVHFHMDVGIQSLSAEVLANTGRRGTVRRSFAALEKLCGLANVDVHADLIAGLPGGTLGRVFDDLGLLVSLGPAEIQLELLKVLPGARLSEKREQWGIVASPEPPYEVLRTAHMTPGDLHTARMLSKLVDWFYAPKPLQGFMRAAGAVMPSVWRELCAYCLAKRVWMKPSLDSRFELLHDFLEPRNLALREKLRYAWMKAGLNPEHRICRARRWAAPLPAGAELIEGDRDAEFSRAYAIDLERTYLFRYGKDRNREAVAVFAVT